MLLMPFAIGAGSRHNRSNGTKEKTSRKLTASGMFLHWGTFYMLWIDKGEVELLVRARLAGGGVGGRPFGDDADLL